MKVLQIGASYVMAQKEVELGIHDFLSQNGHESYILYALGESDNPNIVCYETKFENILRRGLRKYIGKNPHFSIMGTLRILRYIEKWTPDLVHLQIIHHGYMDYILLLKYLAKKKIPVVFTMHDLWAATGGCYYYTTADCKKFCEDCSNCPMNEAMLDCPKNNTSLELKRKLKLYSSLQKLHLVAVSPWVYDEIKKTKISKYPIDTVWNSIQDPGNIPSTERRVEDSFTILGVAANWDDRKGIRRFYELADMLGEEFRICLIGNVTEAICKDAPKNICFIGTVSDRKELFRFYESADLHVTLSMEETFGITLIEAAWAGTRAMGFDSTAVPQVLNKTFGYIIESNSLSDIVQKIRELSENRKDCKLSEKEMDYVRKYFSAERMAAEYFEIYNKILEKDQKYK